MSNRFSGELRDILSRDKCTQEQWKSFFSSDPWKELEDTLHTRLALTRDDLEIQEGTEYYRSQGDVRTLRFVLNISHIIEAEFNALLSEKEN